MNLVPVTNAEDADRLRKEPTLAIDLGFGSKAKSCGLSGGRGKMTFHEAVEATSTWIRECSADKCVLILEAPLSGAFRNGNPVERAPFEVLDNNNAKSDRRWHVGSGGAMALAAVHFLRLIKSCGANLTRKVHLVEGFASRYGTPKPDHHHVAEMLCRAWTGGRPVTHVPVGDGVTAFSSLGLFDHACVALIPVVLRLPDGLTREPPQNPGIP